MNASLRMGAFAVLVASAWGQEIRRLDGSRITFAEAEAFARTTLDEARVMGAQIAIVDKGKLVWSFAHGTRRLDPKLPMTRETNLWAASITKGVFASYVMGLAAKGEFALDVPVAAQLEKPLNEYEAYRKTGAALVSDPRWATVTPRMLLAHTSGLKNFAFLEPDGQMRLHFAPGTRYSYSGEGINLVQFVVEQRRGKPLQELMSEALFQPLGMTRTGMIYRAEFAADVADRFDALGKFRSQTRRFPARGAGSMSTTAEDLARYAVALLANRVVPAKGRREMLRPFVRIGTLHQFALRADEPEGEEAKAVGLAYGMGWGLLTKTKYGPAFFKEGHGDGAQNYMICFERRRACMIVLTNSDNGELAFRPLMERLFGNDVTPWEWEGYTPSYIEAARKQQ